MKLIDNIHASLEDELRADLRDGSKVAIAAAGFSMYAYKELREALSKCEEFRFIFTEPTFSAAEDIKEDKEFVISRRSREKGIYGNAYELKIRNELNTKAVAKECADWASKKAMFRTNISQDKMMGFMCVDDKAYSPIREFSTVELGRERGDKENV